MIELDSETIAEIRNKLQAPLSLLEALNNGKDATKSLRTIAIKDLKAVIKMLTFHNIQAGK